MERFTKIGPKSAGRRFPAMAAVLATFITTGVAFTRVPAQGAASAGGNPDLTVPMLALFRLDRIPLAGKRPWVEAQILPSDHGRAAPRVPATDVLRAHILARLRGAPAELPQHVLLIRPQSFSWSSPPGYALVPQTANLGTRFPPGQVIVAPLGRPVKVGSPPHQRLAYPLSSSPLFDIPARYALQLAPAWNFYVTHGDMFGPKITGTNEKALLGLLTGKNIFLAQEAWRVLIGATTRHHTVSVSPIFAPRTEKFVRKLLSKLSPDRRALFIYEALNQRELSENAYLIAAVRAAQRLVDTATTASQLLPPATACAYFFAWRVPMSQPARQYGGFLGVVHSMLEEIRKKITRFGTHTASGRRITQLLKMDHLSAQER